MESNIHPLSAAEGKSKFEGSKELGFKAISEGELIYELKDGTRFYIRVGLSKLLMQESTSESGNTQQEYGLELFTNIRKVRAEDVVK